MATNKALLQSWVLFATDILIREFAKNTKEKCHMNIDAIKNDKNIHILPCKDKYLVIKLTTLKFANDAFYVEYLGWINEAPTNIVNDSIDYIKANIDSFPFQIDHIMGWDGGLGDPIRNTKVLEVCGFEIIKDYYYWKGDTRTTRDNCLYGQVPTEKFKIDTKVSNKLMNK